MSLVWAEAPVSMIVAVTLAGLVACSTKAEAKPCQSMTLTGDMAARYAYLGGSDGPLGCQTSNEAPSGGPNGMVARFEHGAIEFDPARGTHNVVSVSWTLAGGPGVGITGHSPQMQYRFDIRWGSMSPFKYDFFIVRVQGMSNGPPYLQKPIENQQDVNSGGNRGSAGYGAPAGEGGTFNFLVEGCDHHFAKSSTCEPKWTTPITMILRDPPTVSPPSSGPYSPAGPIGAIP